MAAHDYTGARHVIGASTFLQVAHGTWFHHETPADVRRHLCALIDSGEHCRVFLGDTATGTAWAEKYDVSGFIGRSTGHVKVPLIVRPRANGGPALLDHCIVGILTARGWRYRHPTLNLGTWTTGPATAPGYAADVLHNGTIWARCKTDRAAAQLIAFMTGQRIGP